MKNLDARFYRERHPRIVAALDADEVGLALDQTDKASSPEAVRDAAVGTARLPEGGEGWSFTSGSSPRP